MQGKKTRKDHRCSKEGNSFHTGRRNQSSPERRVIGIDRSQKARADGAVLTMRERRIKPTKGESQNLDEAAKEL